MVNTKVISLFIFIHVPCLVTVIFYGVTVTLLINLIGVSENWWKADKNKVLLSS